jgi:sugar phosphate isomerase/epimerase
MTEMSRRAFIARGAALGAALPLGGARVLDAAVATSPEQAAAQPITVFTKHLQWLDYDELAQVVAETGFDGLDLTVRPGGHVEPERVAEDLPRAVRAARDAGLVVPMITTTIIDARDSHTLPILRAANGEGIAFYRMGPLRYPAGVSVTDAIEKMRPLMRDLARSNERFGIQGAYQNHAGVRVGGPVWDLHLLLRELDPRWIGVQYDIRHATVEGGSSWPLGLRLVAPYVRTTDIKDFHWAKDGDRWVPRTVPLGEGMVDFRQYFELVKELGISGPISVHYEYAPLEGRNELAPPERRQEAITLMRRDLQHLRALLRDAGLQRPE